jgi:hypothetical protein
VEEVVNATLNDSSPTAAVHVQGGQFYCRLRIVERLRERGIDFPLENIVDDEDPDLFYVWVGDEKV